MKGDTKCGEFSFNPFWGELILLERGSVLWRPNFHVSISPREQFKRNKASGHLTNLDVVNRSDFDEQNS